MNKLILTLIALFAVLPLWGQAPDNDAIYAEISNPSSKFYYPTLFGRYADGDATLTLDDYRHLYYGFAFQDEFLPLDPIAGETDILNIIDARGAELTAEDAERVLVYARQVMRRDPFSPANINFMTLAYSVLGDAENAKASSLRLAGVLGAIESSGDGLKETSPWHVIFFTHVNDFLGAKGLEPKNRRVVTRTVEYVTLRVPDGKIKGYYFDFGRAYSKQPTVLPEKPKGLKPKL